MDDAQETMAAARAEAERMLAASAEAAPDAMIRMKASQFRRLAELLGHVADQAARGDTGFAAPIDGIRFWVPLPYLEQERARFARLASERQSAMAETERFPF